MPQINSRENLQRDSIKSIKDDTSTRVSFEKSSPKHNQDYDIIDCDTSEDSIHERTVYTLIEMLVSLVVLEELNKNIDLKLVVYVDDQVFKTDRCSLDIYTHRALFNHYIKVYMPMFTVGDEY